MIGKGLAVLAGAAGVVALGVVGLSWIVVNATPSFDEGFATASTTPEGGVDFVPTAVGAELEVTGAREATVTLDQSVDGPGIGLGNARTRIFFEQGPLQVTQMSHDGLAFFPEPEDCEFAIGQVNEDLGLAAAHVVCPELVDIRDNGSITVEGYVALPADMLVERDLPELGGTVTVGDETWEMAEANLAITPEFNFGGEPEPLFLGMWSGDYQRGLTFEMDRDTEQLHLTQIYSPDGQRGGDGQQDDLSAGSCTIATEHLAQVNPENSIHSLDFDCDEVPVAGMGIVAIEGSVVFSRSDFREP